MKPYRCRAGLVCLHQNENGVLVLVAHYNGKHEIPHIVAGKLMWRRATPHTIRTAGEHAWRHQTKTKNHRAVQKAAHP